MDRRESGIGLCLADCSPRSIQWSNDDSARCRSAHALQAARSCMPALEIGMRPVVQLEPTGCGIASAAAIACVSYRRAQAVARSLGIVAGNRDLWSTTGSVRSLLKALGVPTGSGEQPFKGWHLLPDRALLSIRWHLEGGRPFWHWVVFVREDGRQYVLDSKASLRNHVRTDFGRMKPRWFIRIADAKPGVAAASLRRALSAASRA